MEHFQSMSQTRLRFVLQRAWRSLGSSVYYISAYLIAIIAANLLVVRFGPSVAVLNAFLFIGLDLTARDHLHEVWHHRGLVWKMTALIATGSVLSWLLNRNAGQIALASFAAFACAGIADALAYHLVYRIPRLAKVNASNVAGAVVDSGIFVLLAFGLPFLWPIALGQLGAKIGGGFVWSLVLHFLERRIAMYQVVDNNSGEVVQEVRGKRQAINIAHSKGRGPLGVRAYVTKGGRSVWPKSSAPSRKRGQSDSEWESDIEKWFRSLK